MNKTKPEVPGLLEKIFFILLFVFSSLLMWKTFNITKTGDLQIATKVWSDFAATLPLIRSFSFGQNFPPEYPIFAGPPIRYHFGFYAFVGLLEKIGIPLDFALNIPSSIGFTLLLILIYKFSATVFKNRFIGVVNVILFLFNGSFSFVEFFKENPIGPGLVQNILDNSIFHSFGPYDGKIVSAFWNLNIYTNQRHLSIGYCAFLAFLLMVFASNDDPKKLSARKSVLVGILLGVFPFVHLSVYIMTVISLPVLFIIYPKLRGQLFIIGSVSSLLALPQYLYMGSAEIKTEFINPGYLVFPLTLVNFIKYWFLNIGFSLIFALIGLLLATKNQRKIFLPFFLFFLIGNTFQFTPDIPTNHKFFNLFLIGLNLFSSYFLYRLWQRGILLRITALLCAFIITLSGIIDIFPIFNDASLTIQDVPNNNAAAFIKASTPKNSVFLNSSYLYDPASIAGRKIYMGWPYFSWGAGYDTNKRLLTMRAMLNPKSLKTVCGNLDFANIDYVEISDPTLLSEIEVNSLFFKNNFQRIYYDAVNNYSIYEVFPTCSHLNYDLKRGK